MDTQELKGLAVIRESRVTPANQVSRVRLDILAPTDYQVIQASKESLDIRVIRDIQAFLELKAFQDTQEFQVTLVLTGNQDIVDYLVTLVSKVLRDIQALKDYQAIQESEESLDIQALKDCRVTQVSKVHQVTLESKDQTECLDILDTLEVTVYPDTQDWKASLDILVKKV